MTTVVSSPLTPSAAPVAASPLYVLLHKRDADLAAGAFMRYDPIDPADRSRFSPAEAGVHVGLGLGYLQAVLGALHGLVTRFSYDPPGHLGSAELHSTGGATVYRFSWHEGEESRLRLGGFVHSGGKPTYQSALVGLLQTIIRHRCAPSAATEELYDRWLALLQAMERAFPRADASLGWERRALTAACTHTELRSHLLRVCDSLRTALSYRLPDAHLRDIGVLTMDVLEPGQGTAITLPGSVLLNPAMMSSPGAAPPPVVPPPVRSRRTTRKASASPAPTAPSVAPSTTPSPTSPDSAPITPAMTGAHLERIQRALQRGGPLMLIGPTATGKTTQAFAAAVALGFGVEAIAIDGGWEADDLFGGFTRTSDSEGWTFVPGPVTRWAARAATGESVALLIDELARGHKTVISAVMRLMNEYPASAIERMRLPLPAGEPGPFYLVDIRATQQRMVVPCRRVRIIATANQGEQYYGLDLDDPAFGRRFTGGWLYLGAFPPDETARILGEHLGLPPNAPLMRAMQQVELQVREYQRAEDTLRATLDLATLIAWGKATLIYHTVASTGTSADIPTNFQQTARDLWLERLCPLQGAALDPQVERVLLGFVTAAATLLKG